MNRVLLVGNIGRDAELKYTPKGKALCSFSVATTTFNRQADGQRSEKTEWFRITLWDKRAEALAQYLTKGTKVFVEGPLDVRTYEDRDGKQRYSLDVRADVVEFLGGRQGAGAGAGREEGGGADYEHRGGATSQAAEPVTDDDIPF